MKKILEQLKAIGQDLDRITNGKGCDDDDAKTTPQTQAKTQA